MQDSTPVHPANYTGSVPTPDTTGQRTIIGNRNPYLSRRLSIGSAPYATPFHSPSEQGSITRSPSGDNYVGGAHWAAILDSIEELKGQIGDGSETQIGVPSEEPSHTVLSDQNTGPQLLYGGSPKTSKEEIIASIPPRTDVDRLVSRYFNALDVTPALLHSAKFRRQYEQFWEDPEAAPIVWIGLLFLLMCLATYSLQSSTAAQPQGIEFKAWGDKYREKAIQCLILGNYTKGGPYVLEALILYLAAEALPSEDAMFCNYLLVGIIVHLALRTGYHRDSRHFPNISPFEGEMRQRVWATVYYLDVVVSGQMGLPRMIRDQQVDTEAPRNLIDSDFDENTAVLPPSRPDTELTPILYGIAKYQVASLWKLVDNVSTDIELSPYDQVLQVDQAIRDARLGLPPPLRWTSLAESVTDPLHVIIQRLWLETYFLKLQVVLHKRYALPWLGAAPEREQDHYRPGSQDACVAASMRILELQHMVHEETRRPGGRFCDHSWKISCLLNQEYLLAASMLCAYVRRRQQRGHNTTAAAVAPASAGPEVTAARVPDIPELQIRQLLAKSLAIWERSRMSSAECKKVVEVLTVVLRAAETGDGGGDDDGGVAADCEKQDARVAVSAFASQDYLANFDLPFTFEDILGENMSFPLHPQVQIQGSFLDDTSYL
ncbi:hypothetical protein SLS62_005193 [Diatrype stigma]|uniref:Xylanolytic transcriptional activator regulatory domain-containing protein n=1 Tax=Diatrype stigma TaxID=117547 RepID=A0AAN9UT20_9PEZI